MLLPWPEISFETPSMHDLLVSIAKTNVFIASRRSSHHPQRKGRGQFRDEICAVCLLSIALVLTAFAGCSSKPIVPEAKNVTVKREDAKSSCRLVGPVQGSVSTVHGTVEQAIEDMRLDAARKGANYVRMEVTSAIGTSVSGTAYDCP